MLQPWWDGRLVWGAVDRVGGYRGRHGWYRLQGASLVGTREGPQVVLDVEDTNGRRWTDTRWLDTSIHVEATAEEWDRATTPYPDEAPEYRTLAPRPQAGA